MGWEEDTLSEKGAHSLARKIREYWARRGVAIDAWVEPGRYERDSTKGPSFWVVRSNINIAALRDLNP